MRVRRGLFLELKEKNKVGSLGVGELKKTWAESRALSVPHQSLEGLDVGRGRKSQHSQGAWSEKHWAATPSFHRNFPAFALWEVRADEGCPEGGD